VVIPARNAGPFFAANLVRFADYFAPYRPSYQITYVIVDDASTDETLQRSRDFARYRTNVTVIAHERRRGANRALRSALDRIAAQYTIVIDGRVAGEPAAAMQLLETLEDSGADVAVPAELHSTLRDRVAARVCSLFTRGRCGRLATALRAYRTEFLKGAASSKTARAGARVVELPVVKGFHS
jgi:glycosyltransferase involved in cell wall biosynthesis